MKRQSAPPITENVYLEDMPLAMVKPTDTVYHYHNDHINTPRAMTNSAGTVVWKGLYNAFGHADVDTASTITNNLRFPGQYFDSETNLHYNWNRYYDPRTGRYLTPDPIGLEGGIDPYVYTENNPINLFDYSGLQEIRAFYSQCRIVQSWTRVLTRFDGPALFGQVQGKGRGAGVGSCYCWWQTTGFKKICTNPCGQKEELYPALFDQDRTVRTLGTFTVGGCLCPNPNGEYQQ